MPGLSSTTLRALQKDLAAWFAARKRPLPWRVNYAPYAVWVSEIMLQQTQMDRVVAYFQRWMERFPDIQAVAAADEDDILPLLSAPPVLAPISSIKRRFFAVNVPSFFAAIRIFEAQTQAEGAAVNISSRLNS